MNSRKIEISQKDNYAGNFGNAYRSSAIFYYKQSKSFKTTVSFMDYWKPKRNIEVYILISRRLMDGTLHDRKEYKFENGNMINYCELAGEDFEGSVEVEVFSSRNMVIPYSAIMVIYENENSISMTHSYGRVYSPHEIEEKRTLTVGEESCWTVRDTSSVKSFAVFHNGIGTQNAQNLKLEVLNHKNQTKTFTYNLEELKPYASVRIVPQDIIGDELISFLDGEPGNISVSFDLNGGFTRMLVGNETVSETQVTHSNFNYSRHKTDSIGEGIAHMQIPPAGFNDCEVIIYPHCAQGKYTLKQNGEFIKEFNSGERVSQPIQEGLITIETPDGQLPSRIVTAITAKPATKDAELPYEVSLGIVHKNRPLKSTHWGVIATNSNYESRIFVVPLESVYGDNPDKSLTVNIYLEETKEVMSRKLSEDELKRADQGLFVSELFPQLKTKNYGNFGYYYFRSETYGGFMVYSTIESDQGSLTLEHSF
jgi:hypothetical protein